MSHWLDLPIVSAPHPTDRSTALNYMISHELIDRNAIAARRTPILQLWAHVVGILPPVNNAVRMHRGAHKLTLCTLMDSVACFKGVRRPYDRDDGGDSILVYVINPKVTVEYDPDMTCAAQAKMVPLGSPATVQVRPMETLQISDKDVCGRITRIEFVLGDGGTPALPKGFADRYAERLW